MFLRRARWRPLRLALVACLALASATIVALGSAPPAGATPPACSSSTATVSSMHRPSSDPTTTRPFYSAADGTNDSGYAGWELNGPGLTSDVWVKLSGFSGGSLGLAAHQSASIPARATSQSNNPLVYAYLTAPTASASAQTFTVEVWNGKPDQAGSTELCTYADGFRSVIKTISANSNKVTSISISNSAPAIGGTFQITANGSTGTMGAGDSTDRVSGNGPFSMAPAMADTWPADAFTLTGVALTLQGATTHDRLRVYPSTSSDSDYTAVYSFTVRGTTSGTTSVLPVQNIASGTQVKYTGSYPSTTSVISAPTVTTTLVKTPQSLVSGVATYEVDVSNSSSGTITLDSLQDTPTPSSGWTFVAGSAKLGVNTIADPSTDGTHLFFNGPFTVPAASGGTAGTISITYQLHLTAAVSNSVVGTVGGQTLGATGGSTANQVTVDPASPIVTTGSLANAPVNNAYTATLTASSGTPGYTWAVTSGTLPTGLSLDTSTGVISGTPTVTGTSAFTVTVTDTVAKTASKSLTLTVAAAADVTAPLSPAVSINSGAALTTSTGVTLGLSATDNVGITAYRLAEGSDCSSASWVTVASAASFSASVSFTLSSGDGSKTVCAQYRDDAGNTSSTATSTITLDAAPDVTLSTTASDPTNAAFSVTATFTKAVTGFVSSDVTVGNATISGFAGSGTTYTFTLTPTADGSVTVDVSAGIAQDTSAVGNTAASQLTRVYDATRPSVSLSTPASSSTNAAFTVTATFSESVTGFISTDVTVANAAISGFSGSGTTYTFTVTPASEGAVTVNVAANVAADGAGNGNTAATQLSRTYDVTRPSVTLSTTAAATVNAPFTATATFSETVTGLSLGGITIGNGTASNLLGSGTTYTFTVTPTANGTVTVNLAAGSAADAAGNTNTAAGQLSRIYDGTRPTVVLSTTATSPTKAASITVTITFSKSVTGLALGSFAVGNGAPSSLHGSGASYTIVVTPAHDGTITVDLAAGVAVDSASNTNTAASQLSIISDRTAPVVAITAGPSGSTTDTSATLAFSVADSSATLTCTLDGLAFTPCAAGSVSLAGIAIGSHTFVVTAADAAGNSTSISRSWTVAAPGAPTVTITSAPPASTSSTVASISFTSHDTTATVTCSLDGAAFAPCTSPISVSGLALGTHTFDVRVVTTAGGTSSARASWTVTAPVSTPAGAAAPAPDIHVVMTASSQTVTAGQVFSTTVTATNVGNASASNVSLTIDLPPNTEFVSGDASLFVATSRFTATRLAVWACSVAGRTVVCPVGRLDPAAKYTVNLSLRALKKGTLEVGAQASSSNAKPGHAQVWLNARPPKIEIAVELKTSRSNDRVQDGEIFTATGIVTNIGGSTADDVNVKLELPPIAKFVSGATQRIAGSSRVGASAQAWACTLSGYVIVCPIGDMEPRDQFVIRLQLKALYSGKVVLVAVGNTSSQHNVRSHLVVQAVHPGAGLGQVVHFDSGSAVLSAQARAVLAATEMRVATFHLTKLTLTCHTDDVGSLAYNLVLSRQRCEAVAGFLHRFGRIHKVVFVQSALAYLKPVASNATPLGKAANRRVEIRVR